MSKNIRFEFQGVVYDIQAERRGEVLTLVRDGYSYEVNLAPGGAQTVSNSYVSAVPRSGGAVSAPAAARPSAPAPASAPASAAPVQPAPAVSPGGTSEVAPITGTVKELKVTPGTQVTAGQLIVVMEAMKMDIEVFASSSGTVQSVLVKPGDSVKEKQPLMNLA